MITAERADRLLRYDQTTGHLHWRERAPGEFTCLRSAKTWNTRFSGSLAGHRRRDGYIAIQIDGTLYLAHRLAWLLAHGRWPNDLLDHRDGDCSNNRIDNLRECSNAQNLQNMKAHRDSSTGIVGVSIDRRRGTFSARIMVARTQINLGSYATAGEARDAYAQGKSQFHQFGGFNG